MDHPAHPLIVAQTEKVDALKAHKKGLMKRFFPIMDAKDEVDA